MHITHMALYWFESVKQDIISLTRSHCFDLADSLPARTVSASMEAVDGE